MTSKDTRVRSTAKRATLLRKLLPGADPDLITRLADRPTRDLDLILTAIRQARRDALAEDRNRRQRNRDNRRKHRHLDESDHAAAADRMLTAIARRATINPDALASLAAAQHAINQMMSDAVPALQLRGLSNTEIAAYLGVTRQAVQKRWPQSHQEAASHTDPNPDTSHPGTGILATTKVVEPVFEREVA